MEDYVEQAITTLERITHLPPDMLRRNFMGRKHPICAWEAETKDRYLAILSAFVEGLTIGKV